MMTSNKSDLETIKGVGSSRAEDIREELGIEEVKELAQLTEEELKKVSGIGEKRAEKIFKSVEELVEECSHCGSIHYTDERCSECLEQLERRIKSLKRQLRDKDIPEDEKSRFKNILSVIESKKEEEDLQAGFESLNELEEEVKEAWKVQKPEEKEGLTQIKGIGDSRAKELKEELNIEKVSDLAGLSKEDLTQVKGIGDKKAEKILESASQFIERCERCGSNIREGKTCPKCREELESILEGWKEEIEELGRSYGIRSRLEEKLVEVKAFKQKGELEEAFKLTDELEEDIKDSEELKTLLDRIDTKIDENRDLIDFSIYNKGVEDVEELLNQGKYKRGIKKGKKLLEHIENEKTLAQMDKEELAQLSIGDFCRKIRGPRAISGEKIHKAGYNTVRDVAKVGAARIEKEGDIDGDTAETIIKRIDDLLGEEEFEVKEKIEEELEELEEEEEEEEETPAEEIFKEAEVVQKEEAEVESAKEMFEEITEFEEEKEPKKEAKKPSRKEKPQRQIKKSISTEESEETEITVSKIYWLPAIILPIIFVILGLFLFVL